MTLALQELHADVAEAVRRRVRGLLEAGEDERRALSDAERAARDLLERDETEIAKSSRRGAGTVPGLIAGAAIIGMYLNIYFDGSFLFYAAPGIVTFFLCIRETSVPDIARAIERRRFGLEEMRAILPLVLHGSAESLYREAVLSLCDRDIPLDEPTRRDILRQVNALLDTRLHLEAHRAKALRRMDPEAVARLEAERDALALRIEQTTDTLATATLRDGLELCERRLHNARALAPMLERLDAQREVIHQALATVASALSRLQTASATLTAFSATDIRETVRRIDSQTRAVEQAVEEVMMLRLRG